MICFLRLCYLEGIEVAFEVLLPLRLALSKVRAMRIDEPTEGALTSAYRMAEGGWIAFVLLRQLPDFVTQSVRFPYHKGFVVLSAQREFRQPSQFHIDSTNGLALLLSGVF